MSELKLSNYISMDFLDKYSYLNKQIVASTEQNKALIEESQLQDSKKAATQNLESNVKYILSGIQAQLKNTMYKFNNNLYGEKRNAPTIELKNCNSYKF
jgi:DNA repair ATPase